jgi:PE family
MSFVFAAPEYVAAAATDLANIGSSISAANSAALTPTSSVLAAAADEVSAAVASLFGAHGQAYQALGAQAARFHQQVRAAHEFQCGPIRLDRSRERQPAAAP